MRKTFQLDKQVWRLKNVCAYVSLTQTPTQTFMWTLNRIQCTQVKSIHSGLWFHCNTQSTLHLPEQTQQNELIYSNYPFVSHWICTATLTCFNISSFLFAQTELKLYYNSWNRGDRFNESNITEHANFVNDFFSTKLTCARKTVLQIITSIKI